MSDVREPSDLGIGALPERASDDDVVDRIVADCIESGERLAERVDTACREHPRLETAIRRRFEVLRSAGLLREERIRGEPRLPERLGGYRLLDRLGEGGMGVVFRARQESLGRDVALKLIRPEHAFLARARERFQREVEAIAQLEHPNIVPVIDVGEDGGVPYFTMALIPGCTLHAALARLAERAPQDLTARDLAYAVGQCAPEWVSGEQAARPAMFTGSYVRAVVSIALEIARALEHAHERSVLHRDVKPSNIAITPDGRALLFDFGLASIAGAAKLTGTHAELGSLHYMSPEQLRGDQDRIDRRTDVYALGVTLHEALALQLPFAERDLVELRRAILDGRHGSLHERNPSVPRDLEVVVGKAMDPDPARRYATAGELASDLAAVLEHRPIRARPPTTVVLVSRWAQRHPAAAVAIAAVFAIGVGVPSVLLAQQHRHSGELQAQVDKTKAEREIAIAKLRETDEVNRFLVELFTSIDPKTTRGRELTAHDLLDRGAERLGTELTDQPLVRASLLDSIAKTYLSLGDFTRAQSLLERSLALREQFAGARSLEASSTLYALAQLERRLSKPEALDHARRAVELRRELAREPDETTVSCLMVLGLTAGDAHRLPEARAAFEEALAVAEKLPGDNRQARALVLSNLGEALVDAKEYERAVEMSSQAVELQRSIDREPNPFVTATLNDKARALTNLGRFDEARATFTEILAEEEHLSGVQSERYASMLVNAADLAGKTGDGAGERAMLEQAMATFESVAPVTHRSALTCREHLLTACVRDAQWPRAAELAEKLVEIREQSGEIAADAGRFALYELALCREAQGRPDDAIALAERAAIDSSAGAEPSRRDWAALARCRRIAWLAERGDIDRARDELERMRSSQPSSDPSTSVGAWATLAEASVEAALGETSAAVARLEPLAALDITARDARLAPMLARAQLALLLAGSDPQRSNELSSRARTELERALGPTHPRVVAFGR